ncbi:FadR/GntR family transcriptional regulator [Aureimonas sp. ME7]|uniref:FadR/GntR family transcriptional regulator n=1 Tax=Aureimonas sp. ME7 TaxID=2744252 RepID=UPI0015FA23A4|nr:FadR/GntR family transcriptional regulator [Aureimonas sp. ME7]
MPRNDTPQSGTLVARTVANLRKAIAEGAYKPGERIPSEAQMTVQQGVSRTVIREAVAALRADGLVEPRQGAGVFVLPQPEPASLPFQGIDYDKISNVLELLELRLPIEVEAAGLAAVRRSPGQEEAILRRQHEIESCEQQGTSTVDADFNLHLAIADATNNSRFREFLTMMGRGIIPRSALAARDTNNGGVDLALIHREHAVIVAAILDGDADGAREGMRLHLKGSQLRYRQLLQSRR